MRCFCDARAKTSTIRTEAAQRATYLGSFQTHPQGNSVLPPTAVPAYLRWSRCSTKGPRTPHLLLPIQLRSLVNVTFVSLSQEQMVSGRPGGAHIHLTLPGFNSFSLTNLIQVYSQMLSATAARKLGPVREQWSRTSGQGKRGQSV